ncbi:Elongation of very long chain fatty acids protein [Portunus trituberculatus]|uniref:Elongation of very long chain fatty acids protein n=1 Tax=Portunus trituberculatus TaxID=210409 RepID=A0A5B7GGI0_PORTR|nr:Elongation of very long chain fatty acids protein [Portunus trituberculatus]
MTHLRRTYDTKSLEHDTPSHHPVEVGRCQQVLDTKQADPRRLDHDTKAKPQGPPNTDETLAKLRSNGIKAAALTLFLYFYGNQSVLGQMKKDPRVDSWFYSSPTPTLLISLAYIAGVTYIGPRMMRGRETPKWLRGTMVFYNIVQVVFCSWMFWEHYQLPRQLPQHCEILVHAHLIFFSSSSSPSHFYASSYDALNSTFIFVFFFI